MGLPKEDFFNPYKILGILGTSQQLDYWVSEKTYPVHVKFDLTGVCNLHCVFCSGIKSQSALLTSKIPWNILENTLRELGEHNCRAVTFTGGGEPLLYPKIEKCLELTRSLGLSYGLTTNAAIPFSPRLQENLKEASWIRVSLNAATAETYQAVHQPRTKNENTFELVLNNLKELRSICSPKTRLGCSFLIEEHNWSEIFLFAQDMKEIGLDYIQYKLLYIPSGQSIYDTQEYAEYADEIMQSLDKAREIETFSFKIIFPKSRASVATKDYQSCWVQHFSTHVGVDSNIYPCCILTYRPEASLGSLLDQPFDSIWRGSVREEKIKHFGSACPRCWWDSINDVLDKVSIEISDGLFI